MAGPSILIKIAIASALVIETVVLLNLHSKGYVITTKGDTIACTFKIALNKYKPEGDATFHLLQPEEVKEYHLNKRNETLRDVPFPNREKTYYMTVLDTGKITLYKYYERHGKSGTLYIFAQKAGQPLLEIKGSSNTAAYKIAFANLISHSQPATNSFTKASVYDEKNIVNVVKIYNDHATP
ncbi:hypothetical protein [Mucilaginibacter polytrichastri]|uniref:Uncharacterized protein n=1 Tax=Mucilaginibacter polytrichastri TaxID=1302689 RepID=A0A1Q5ZUP2_9SPHI|nr:hypothetical protein [Mucilaginibacter polytrichastri]OKS85499.1 hypothetical protein RG47T_0945 [Mucilaginibacter polytrichastri]SFS37740.1 hypothetical protein SAMN04487890_101155 [Mucilaginibacter polytrichastri]